jgi:hypothetical protein
LLHFAIFFQGRCLPFILHILYLSPYLFLPSELRFPNSNTLSSACFYAGIAESSTAEK